MIIVEFLIQMLISTPCESNQRPQVGPIGLISKSQVVAFLPWTSQHWGNGVGGQFPLVNLQSGLLSKRAWAFLPSCAV